jgi:hypothetical protein
MQHAVDDSYAALERARREYVPGWHPLLSAVESEPGEWMMMAQYGRCYGVIRLLELGGERGYRVVTWAEQSSDRELVGYFRTLRAAAAAAHTRYLETHAPRPGVT